MKKLLLLTFCLLSVALAQGAQDVRFIKEKNRVPAKRINFQKPNYYGCGCGGGGTTVVKEIPPDTEH